MPKHLRKNAALAGLALGGVLALGFAAPAIAATATSQFQVTATVAASCAISSTNLAFGTYGGTQADATSTVTVSCTNGTAWTVGLDAGTSGGTTTTRKMTGPGGALLGYGLFQDAGRTTNWGNNPPTDTEGGTGTGSNQNLTVFGRVPASQVVTPGSYADTITATITF